MEVVETQDKKPIVRRKKSCRITIETVEEIADLVANSRLNETEACKVVGINPLVWHNWKHRNKSSEKYDDCLTRLRAKFIAGRVATIKAAETKDWRAADRLLQIVAPERFSPKHEQQPINVAVVADSTLLAALDKAYGSKSLPDKQIGQITDVQIEPAS